ncbi:MAG: ATP-binding protein [Thermodesulfobacteriota bacterium]
MTMPQTNTVEGLEEQRASPTELRLATLNILEDFNAEKVRLEGTQRAVLNILEDFSNEKRHLEDMHRATLNILEDFNAEKARLEETQRAVLNILEDFEVEKTKVEKTNLLLERKSEELNRSNEELQKAHAALELRVHERTADLRRTNLQLMAEMEERKKAEDEIRKMVTDLERSNEELEQFAYVASHDLQEPLRMVSSYTQLLAERLGEQLDEKSKKFISYAVDGAMRMQQLIQDLLSFSRVTTRGSEFRPVDSHKALTTAMENLQGSIRECGALITNDDLPPVTADQTQLVQVFQNLISNAIKFRRQEQPRVHIAAQEEDHHWRFSVTDNGIGIEPRHKDKVFAIFQRLHTREEYPGTGIGLALCKRIVQRHGGDIWFDSSPGKGTTFYFTFAKRTENGGGDGA